MSVAHLNAAWDALVRTRNERILLLAYGRHACAFCGMCWPGNVRLELMCLLGETALSEARQSLVAQGYIKIHAYPRGGRGRATEIIVLLAGTELSTGPCGKCVENMKTPRRARGFEPPDEQNPPPSGT